MSVSTLQADLVATTPLRLLVVGPRHCWPAALSELTARREIELLTAPDCAAACDPGLLRRADAVIVCAARSGDDPGSSLPADLQLLADALLSSRLTGIVLAPEPVGVVPPGGGSLVAVPPHTSAAELWGRVCTIRQYRPLLLQFEKQVAAMQRLGKKLNQQFVEVDQELRLASRLQRDFLPKSLPEVGDIRFATMFRPASWVSGDIYDIFRIDEEHLGCYLADAVGHGIAAGLLTMFIKQAVVGKRIDRDRYTIVPPGEVLAGLNAELTRQELPNCQFVTACYALIDVPRHEITFARGGHPHPIHVSADGRCSEVRTVGGLLGVFPHESFPALTLQLQPGEKFILYSDGLEDHIVANRDRHCDQTEFTSDFQELMRLPLAEAIPLWIARVDGTEGSLQPADDMTVVAIERLR